MNTVTPRDQYTVTPRDQYGRTLKFCKLHRCKTDDCRAQTSNDYCAKCVKARIYETTAELLIAADMTVEVAAVCAQMVEEDLYGVPSASMPAKGILNA